MSTQLPCVAVAPCSTKHTGLMLTKSLDKCTTSVITLLNIDVRISAHHFNRGQVKRDEA